MLKYHQYDDPFLEIGDTVIRKVDKYRGREKNNTLIRIITNFVEKSN